MICGNTSNFIPLNHAFNFSVELYFCVGKLCNFPGKVKLLVKITYMFYTLLTFAIAGHQPRVVDVT